MLKQNILFLLLFAVMCLMSCSDVTVTKQPDRVRYPDSIWDKTNFDTQPSNYN